MNMGGIEKSLISLTSELVKSNDVYVLLLNDTFGKNLFDPKVKFIESNKTFRLLNPQKKYTKSQKSFFSFVKGLMKIVNLKGVFEKLVANKKVVFDKFDIAVAFHGEDYITCNQVANMVDAEKKFIFLHFDVSKVKIKKSVFKTYFKYDKIICVSESCEKLFKKMHPQFAEKVDYLYNICDKDFINKKSKEFEIKYDQQTMNIISVSRLSKEKAYLRSLKVFKKIHDEGYKFIWHILGDGDQRKKIEKFISSNNMGNYIKLYGNKINPYPYIKNADLFFLGSFHESFGISMIEAMMLNTPVVSTRTVSSEEILADKGIVCENNSEDIYSTLKKVLSSKGLVNELKQKIKDYNLSKNNVIEKFSSF